MFNFHLGKYKWILHEVETLPVISMLLIIRASTDMQYYGRYG